MRNNALGVANELIDLADKDGKDLTLLKLVKLVFLSYAFGLVLAKDEPLIDPRFDKVEAWRYGPVIPSVYHSFKHLRNKPIKPADKAVVLNGESHDCNDGEFVVPSIKGDLAKRVIRTVWARYSNATASELVDLLHRDGTPWSDAYVPGMNRPILESDVKDYYTRFLDILANLIKERE